MSCVAGLESLGRSRLFEEVYSFLRSPYRDLALYDAVAQYDPVPVETDESAEEVDALNTLAVRGKEIQAAARPDRQASIGLDDREDDVIDLRSVRSASPLSSDEGNERGRRQSISRSQKIAQRSRSRASSYDSLASRDRSRSRSPSRRPMLSRTHPRRWNEADTYFPPTASSRRVNADSWVDPDMRRGRKSGERNRLRERRAGDASQDLVAEVGPKKPVHRGLRGWNEVDEEDEVIAGDVDPDSRSGIHGRPGSFTDAAPKRISIRGMGSLEHDRNQADPLENDADDESTWGPDDDLEGAPSAPQFELTATSDKAREAVLALRDKRAERREKLLSKLTREKRASKRKPLHETQPQVMVKQVTSHGVNGDASTSAQNASPAMPSRLSTQEAEDKAKAKLMLKLRLAKEKRQQQQEPPATSETSTAVPTSPAPRIALIAETASSESDRAAMLRAKLMAMKERKKAAEAGQAQDARSS